MTFAFEEATASSSASPHPGKRPRLVLTVSGDLQSKVDAQIALSRKVLAILCINQYIRLLEFPTWVPVELETPHSRKR